MKRKGGRLIVLALLLIASGCSSDSGGGVLLRDDFEDPGSGWGEAEEGEFARGYDDGEYFFEMCEPNWLTWVPSEGRFTDVAVQVDAYLASGSPEAHYGVLCRYVDGENFYYFAVSADGYYAIFRRVDGEDLQVLTGDGVGMMPSSEIVVDGQINRIRAVCEGEALSLHVNGELLEETSDDSHARGGVGLAVGSGPEGDARVHFDDLVVRER